MTWDLVEIDSDCGLGARAGNVTLAPGSAKNCGPAVNSIPNFNTSIHGF
jgi:hypothetical protein